jgi:ribosomal protein L7/L12
MSLFCSHCGAPRTTNAAACPFCKTLYGSPAPPGAPAPATDAPADVVAALRGGNKIEAIRLYRAAHKASLVEAKSAVEKLERELGLAR